MPCRAPSNACSLPSGSIGHFQIDNAQIGSNYALVVHEYRNGNWVQAADFPVVEPSERARPSFSKQVFDFDEHLEDISVDWFNMDFVI